MLDAFIIDEIKRRKEQEEIERDRQRPRQEIPIPQNINDEEPTKEEVVIIDYVIASSKYLIKTDFYK